MGSMQEKVKLANSFQSEKVSRTKETLFNTISNYLFIFIYVLFGEIYIYIIGMYDMVL